jgi:hypothetical protein
MNKKDLYFIGLMVAVLGVFITLSLNSRKAQAMTPRPEHGGITKDTRRETCFECHSPDAVAPLPPHHPKKGLPDETKGKENATPTPCSACHRLPQGSVSAFYLPGLGRGQLKWLSRQQE